MTRLNTSVQRRALATPRPQSRSTGASTFGGQQSSGFGGAGNFGMGNSGGSTFTGQSSLDPNSGAYHQMPYQNTGSLIAPTSGFAPAPDYQPPGNPFPRLRGQQTFGTSTGVATTNGQAGFQSQTPAATPVAGPPEGMVYARSPIPSSTGQTPTPPPGMVYTQSQTPAAGGSPQAPPNGMVYNAVAPAGMQAGYQIDPLTNVSSTQTFGSNWTPLAAPTNPAGTVPAGQGVFGGQPQQPGGVPNQPAPQPIQNGGFPGVAPGGVSGGSPPGFLVDETERLIAAEREAQWQREYEERMRRLERTQGLGVNPFNPQNLPVANTPLGIPLPPQGGGLPPSAPITPPAAPSLPPASPYRPSAGAPGSVSSAPGAPYMPPTPTYRIDEIGMGQRSRDPWGNITYPDPIPYGGGNQPWRTDPWSQTGTLEQQRSQSSAHSGTPVSQQTPPPGQIYNPGTNQFEVDPAYMQQQFMEQLGMTQPTLTQQQQQTSQQGVTQRASGGSIQPGRQTIGLGPTGQAGTGVFDPTGMITGKPNGVGGNSNLGVNPQTGEPIAPPPGMGGFPMPQPQKQTGLVDRNGNGIPDMLENPLGPSAQPVSVAKMAPQTAFYDPSVLSQRNENLQSRTSNSLARRALAMR